MPDRPCSILRAPALGGAIASLLVALSIAALLGCSPTQSPQLRVLGVQSAAPHDVVFMQVTNPAREPMRLTRLQYTFAAAGAKVSEGDVELAREIPAGSAVVVEIPVDRKPEQSLTLSGKLTTELNQIAKIFSVSARIEPAR